MIQVLTSNQLFCQTTKMAMKGLPMIFCVALLFTLESAYVEAYSIFPIDSGDVRIGRKLLNATTPAPVAAVAEDKSFFEQVEEFYEDKNNFAMYLVLPCIVLVYGGCSAIYCCYKCRQQLCSKKKGKGKDDDDDDGGKHSTMANQTNDKMSLIGGSPENPGKKAAANQIRPASKASISDVNVGMGNETPLPWAIPEKEDKPSPAIVKLPPAYSDFQTNQQANNLQNMQNFNPQLQQAQMQGMQQPMPYNPNAFPMQMMQHPNSMYQPTIIPIPVPMDYHDSKRNNRRDRRLSREDSYDDMDDYHSPPRNQRKQSNNRRNSNSPWSGKQSKHDDFDDSDDDYYSRQGRSNGNSRRDSPRNSRTPDRGKHGRERRRSDDRNGNHRDYSPTREDNMSARSDKRRSSPERRSDDRKSRRPDDRRSKDRGYSPTDTRDRPSREDTMSARSTKRTRSPDERKGRRSDDRDPDERRYSPTNPRNRPSREDTMSARSDKRRSALDEKDDPKPRKINEVKPTPQKPKIADKPSDTNPDKKDNPPKKPPPRPAQPAKKPQNKNQQDDRIMSPPPPYEGHERRNSLDAVFEAAENPGNRKGPAKPSYNPNPTIRVISQTKGGGPVSGMEMAKQAAEMLRVDNPNIGRKKPKRLVFVAE